MSEAVVMAALGIIGSCVLFMAGFRDRLLLVAAALPTAIGAMTAAALLTVPLPMRTMPTLLLLVVTMAMLVSMILGRSIRDRSWLWPVMASAAVHAAGAALARWGAVVNVTPDSFQYVTSARRLAQTGDLLAVDPFLLETRQLTLPLLHGLASEPIYLVSLSPLVMLSGLVLLVWFGTALAGSVRVPQPTNAWLTAAVLLLVVTNPRVIYHTYYLNGHGLFAVLVLIIGAGTWLQATHPRPSKALIILVAAAAVALVPLRPESVLVLALVLSPWIAVAPHAAHHYGLVAAAAGATAIGWSAALTVARTTAGGAVPGTTRMIAAAGLVLLLMWPVLRLINRKRWLPWILVAGHLGLWVATYVLHQRRPDVLRESIIATYRNVVLGEGLWGSSLLILAALLLVVVALRRWDHQIGVVLPLVSFIPVAAVLALMRGAGAYRPGPGDSLNRMLMHFVPLMALGLLAAGWSNPRRGTPAGAHGIRQAAAHEFRNDLAR